LALSSDEISLIWIYEITNTNVWHELGHTVYKFVLTPFQRLDYQGEFNTSMIYVSDYAMLNPSEDFAETFSRFIKNKCYQMENCTDCPGITKGRLEVLCKI